MVKAEEKEVEADLKYQICIDLSPNGKRNFWVSFRISSTNITSSHLWGSLSLFILRQQFPDFLGFPDFHVIVCSSCISQSLFL